MKSGWCVAAHTVSLFSMVDITSIKRLFILADTAVSWVDGNARATSPKEVLSCDKANAMRGCLYVNYLITLIVGRVFDLLANFR